jgi:hypothetical protein
MIQVETTIADWTRDKSDGLETEELVIGETAVKYGLTDRMDLELIVSPFGQVTLKEAGERDRESGFGDVVLRAKYRVTGDSSPLQATVMPFVKFPTAKRSLGNGKVEGGIAVPIQWSIPGSTLSLTLGPELDIVADGDGDGYHLGMVQLIGLGLPLSSSFSVSADILGAWDWDPAGTTRQYTAGASAAYLLSNDVQLDAGVNVGLNEDAPDVQVYSGIAFRF